MAGSTNEPQPRVAHAINTDGIVITDTPKLDLDSYIQNYRGRTRTSRLLLIASTSTVLAVDALKLAAQEIIRTGKDTQQYRLICDELKSLAPHDPDAKFNRQWAEQTDKANHAEQQRLETQLRAYKNNLVKESIRMGNEDLAKHLEGMGELSHAYEVYAKMRSDASTTEHIIKGGLHLARLAIYRREWTAVMTNVNKINGLSVGNNTKDKDSNTSEINENKGMRSLCLILYGIAQLGQAKYSEASASFLLVDSSIEPCLYDEFASPNDIATYGGLLALATMSRSELTSFLDHSAFRSFLELEPHLRRAMSQFVSGRYSACLSILDNYRSDYLLDIYLQPHVEKLFSMVRAKCIHHFLQPFSCVTIKSMNTAFAQSGQSMEAELEDMIRSGNLQARIDTIDQVVTTTTVNPRAKMQAEALIAAKNYEKEALDRVRRIGILSAELEVKGKQKGHAFQAQDARWANGEGMEF